MRGEGNRNGRRGNEGGRRKDGEHTVEKILGGKCSLGGRRSGEENRNGRRGKEGGKRKEEGRRAYGGKRYWARMVLGWEEMWGDGMWVKEKEEDGEGEQHLWKEVQTL